LPVYRLSDDLVFPPAERADRSGLLAVGGDARPERLILAYSLGIFPWPHRGYPLLWFSPDPRFVITLDDVHVHRSLKKAIKRAPFEVRFDTAFTRVMEGCSSVPRPGQDGTWITQELIDGYTHLHALGYAHSIEAWDGDELVGGLYGVSLGRAFFGESMFARADDSSKIAFATLLAHLRTWGFAFVDCQVHTDHLSRFGAVEIPRRAYLALLRDALTAQPRRGTWEVTLNPEGVLAALAG
jgi:leucyl/phenylalanyl-tRNA--protein transferase